MFVTTEEMELGLDHIKSSPSDAGAVELIVFRPGVDERVELQECELNCEYGLVGDSWLARGHRKMPGGVAHPDMQLNLMNSRVIDLIAGQRERWKLAGDQFYVDFDLSDTNLPPGTRLQLGDAIIEVTAEPHLGCKKFMQRFGKAATLFVNTELGKSLNLRGINAKVISAGKAKVGDRISKL